MRSQYINAKYDSQPLSDELKRMFGSEVTMSDEILQTGLLVVTKRLDSGSAWPISNNPKGRYFATRENSSTIGNGEYPIWNVVRASSAAPTYFQSERIEIAKGSDTKDPVVGDFIDGGVSPHNNPALQALMYSTLEGYNVNWEKGADKLLLVSMGTGTDIVSRKVKRLEALTGGGEALESLMDDNASLVETLLQWMSSSPTAKIIDRELGSLAADSLGSREVMTYLRYNIPLNLEYLNSQAYTDLTAEQAQNIATLDSPKNMSILQVIGNEVGKKIISDQHFPVAFDLPPA
jgi:patatin-like phospholipase/acyl hydrolase